MSNTISNINIVSDIMSNINISTISYIDISIYYLSFVCLQSNDFKYCYVSLTIQLNSHLFTHS